MRAGKAELGKGANSAKDFGGDEGFDPAEVFGAEKLEDLAAGDDDFGGFGAGEVAVNGGDYAGRLLESETVEVHGSGGVRLRVRVLRVEGEGFEGKRVKVSEEASSRLIYYRAQIFFSFFLFFPKIFSQIRFRCKQKKDLIY